MKGSAFKRSVRALRLCCGAAVAAVLDENAPGGFSSKQNIDLMAFFLWLRPRDEGFPGAVCVCFEQLAAKPDLATAAARR